LTENNDKICYSNFLRNNPSTQKPTSKREANYSALSPNQIFAIAQILKCQAHVTKHGNPVASDLHFKGNNRSHTFSLPGYTEGK